MKATNDDQTKTSLIRRLTGTFNTCNLDVFFVFCSAALKRQVNLLHNLQKLRELQTIDDISVHSH